MSGWFTWEWTERDPSLGGGFEWLCIPHLSPTLDGEEAEGGGGLPNPGTGMGLDGKMTASRRWWDFDWNAPVQTGLAGGRR